MKNNKGFAISSVVYAMLVLFLGLILLILGNLASRKAAFDKEKNEILSRFNADSEILCTANTTKVRALVWNGIDDPVQVSSYKSDEVGLLASESGAYTPGVTYTCNVGDGERTFYVLEESGDNVSLILGTNLGNTVEWSSDGDNSNGPVTALSYLSSSTGSWSKLDPSQISLPSAYQIATASGKTFDVNNGVSGLSTWLVSYTDTNIAYGYWTSTPNASGPGSAWIVDFDGNLSLSSVTNSFDDGVRPVITIKKSQVKNLEPILCNAKISVTNGNLAYGEYNYGDEYSCELGDGEAKTFYVLETSGDNVSLIMNMNIGGTTAWSSDVDNSNEPVTAEVYLAGQTSGWTKLSSSQINLPTGQQIATAGRDREWTDSNSTGNTLPIWLYENLNGSGAPYGYWTSTSKPNSSSPEGFKNAWEMDSTAILSSYPVNDGLDFGVRPVIIIKKSQVKNLELPILCTAVTELSTQYIHTANGSDIEDVEIKPGKLASAGDPYAYGVEYTCDVGDGENKTFYVLEDGDTTTLTEGRIAQAGEVSLIMNMNVGSDGKGTTDDYINYPGWVTKQDYLKAGGTEEDWGEYGNNNLGPITANNYLEKNTTRWTKLNSSQISLPSAYQIAAVEGKSLLTDGDDFSLTNRWLNSNLYPQSVGGSFGYYTSTAHLTNTDACYIVANTYFGGGGLYAPVTIRPVITIPKKNIKN